jgi:hypothetical protein
MRVADEAVSAASMDGDSANPTFSEASTTSRHEWRKEIQMTVVHKAILWACWQQENENGMHAARPWLRWFLTRVVGMKRVPARESETERMRKEQWLAVRREAGFKIDPETAEVFWEHGQVGDPYGLCDPTDEGYCVGRNYFARSPGSDLWISFHDLPAVVCDRLWARMRAGDFDDKDMAFIW